MHHTLERRRRLGPKGLLALALLAATGLAHAASFQHPTETGTDYCDGCPAQCVERIDPWTTTYWPIGATTC